MNIGITQILVTVILVIFGSVGFILANESRRDRAFGPVMFMGRKGRTFLTLLGIITLPVFIGSAIYLGFTAWVLCVTGVPLTLIVFGRLLSPIVYRWVVYPLYKVYSLFYREKDEF